jgi:quinol monooxygenase YgiN
MLIVINEFHVQPGREARFDELFSRVASLIVHEPGCRSCRLHRERGTPSVYVSYLEWDSEAALAAPHDPAIGALIEQYPLTEPPHRRRFDLVLAEAAEGSA